MKYLLKIILGLTILAGAAVSCKDDDDDNAGITGFSVNREDITIGADGGTDVIKVVSGSEWVAQSSSPWVSITPANGMGNTECTVVIDSTLVNEIRTAEIRFIPKGQTEQKISVHQTGYGKGIYVEEQEVEIEASDNADKRFFNAVVTTNVSFKVEMKCLPFEVTDEEGNLSEIIPQTEWIATHEKNPVIELDRGARPRTDKIRFDWNINPEWGARVAEVHFIPLTDNGTVDPDTPETILTVTQKASPVITNNRAGDSLAILAIRERLNMMNTLDASENMRNWANVTLWEKTDKELPEEAAIGRVRSVSFAMFKMKETIPQEVKYLRYLETLSFYSNTNTMLLNIDLGSDICQLKHLKNLQIGAYGLVSLPDNFKELGQTLEMLDLDANNFNHIPDILTPENFPKLKSLNLIANRRWGVYDLRNVSDYSDRNGIGFHFNLNENAEAFKRLLMWDNLEELSLSYNYIEGSLPEFNVGDIVNMGNGKTKTVEAYTQSDVDAFGGDTIANMIGRPKILPHTKIFSVNLNFLTGNLPEWIMYHPHLLDWEPEIFIYNQMENGVDSNGDKVKFDNQPANFEYYFDFFPGYREKYEVSDTSDD